MQPQVETSKQNHMETPSAVGSGAVQKNEKSSLVSRNVTIGTHRTSIRLEPEMWVGLRDLCRREHVTLHDIATMVSERKAVNTSLTAAIRVFIMAYFRASSTEDGHNRAGHGPGGAFMISLVSKTMGERQAMTANHGVMRNMCMSSVR